MSDHFETLCINGLSNSSTTLTLSMFARTVERSSSSPMLHKGGSTLRWIAIQHFRWYLASYSVAFTASGILFRQRISQVKPIHEQSQAFFFIIFFWLKPVSTFLLSTWQIMHFVLSYNVDFDLNDFSSLFGMFPFFKVHCH